MNEIHILPNEVIDPVVYYYGQIAALSQFIEDLRGERHVKLGPERKIAMFQDYTAMGAFALELANKAIDAIEGNQ